MIKRICSLSEGLVLQGKIRDRRGWFVHLPSESVASPAAGVRVRGHRSLSHQPFHVHFWQLLCTCVPTPKESTVSESSPWSCARIAASTVCFPSSCPPPRAWYAEMLAFATRSANRHVDVRAFSAERTASFCFAGAPTTELSLLTASFTFTYTEICHGMEHFFCFS